VTRLFSNFLLLEECSPRERKYLLCDSMKVLRKIKKKGGMQVAGQSTVEKQAKKR
jgi:hypothetical protein